MKKIPIVVGGGEHPMSEIAHLIFGTNIVRTIHDLAGAPASLKSLFRTIRTKPEPYSIRCGCCGEPMRRAKGMAVFRLIPNDVWPEMMPFGLCAECLDEKDDNELHRRIIKMMTGLDRQVVNWKDTGRTLQ